MSYAAVAAHNAPPVSEQPQPDQGLLNTEPPSADPIVDDTSKVNIVPQDFKENPRTVTQESVVYEEESPLVGDFPQSRPSKSNANANGYVNAHSSNNSKESKRSKATRQVHEVQAEGLYIWQSAKHYLLRPGVAGGLVGLVNIGLLASVGRMFYTRPHLRRDATALSSTIACTIALFSAEGYAAEQYRQTPRGRQEERKAREEGAAIYRHLHTQIMRPGVLGGLVGLVNTAILGTLGYVSYTNWNRPWDRKVVSAVSVGLLTLWGGEGIIAERFANSR